MLFIFSTPVLIRHLWQVKTFVFLLWCLISALPLHKSCYAKCHNDECSYAYCIFTICYDGCHCAECRFTDSHNAEEGL